MFNEEELKIVKEKAIENHIPIIMDDTLEKIEEILKSPHGKNVAAIVPVHIAGNVCNMKHIMELAEKYNVKVIEGKSPNIFLSASVSETIGEQSQYVKNKAFNDQYYRDLIVKYLEQYGSAKKRDVRELLWDKLPEVMDDKQKESKVKNLLAQMRRTGIITIDSENQQRSSWIN